MSATLQELVERFGGQLIGDGNIAVTGIAPLADALPTQLSFLSNSKFRAQAAQCRAAALILSPADQTVLATEYSGAYIVTPNPYAFFAKVLQYFTALHAIPPKPGIHPSAVVDDAAVIASSASIGPHAVIEADAQIDEHVVIGAGCFIGRGAKIAAGTVLHARAVVHHGCEIGQRGIIYSGAVIGSDGFGHANEAGVWIMIPQVGRVLIGDDVRVGANTTIDRGAMADTVIENGVKLDNQIHIAHNCHIGEHTAMAGCVGVAGSAKIGKHCTFGGAAMILGQLTIADHVHISSGSLVSRSIREPGMYTGFYPLAKNADWEKSAAIVRNLPTMREKIRDLEKNLHSSKDDKE